MDSNVMDELLAAVISQYGGAIGTLTKKAAMKLKSESIEDQITIGDEAFRHGVDILGKCGNLLCTDEEEKTAAAVVMAGAAGMNPAMVVVKAEENTLFIKATAKEGLIKQHTAEKAVKKLKDAFDEAGMK